jgi:hypothetical protein
MKAGWRAALGMVALVLLPGCATHYLWTESTLSEKYFPADQPHLQIYKLSADFLAVYDESTPRGAVKRRAYLVQANDRSNLPRKKPRFVEANLAEAGQPIPVFDRMPNAGATTNGLWGQRIGPFAFELHDGGSYLGSYQLPAYRGAANTTAQVAITPLAVAADVTVVAAVVWVVAYGGYHSADFGDCDISARSHWR